MLCIVLLVEVLTVRLRGLLTRECLAIFEKNEKILRFSSKKHKFFFNRVYLIYDKTFA